MPLINCEINLMLIKSANCVICEADRATAFVIADTKLYIAVVTVTSRQYKAIGTIEIRFGSKEQATGTNVNQNY